MAGNLRPIVLLAAVLVAAARPASAEPSVVWHCWYDADGKFLLTCALPDPGLVGEAGEEAGTGDAIRARWRRALHANELGLAARLVRLHPLEFTARRLYIPLYGPPAQDLVQAERLARAAMCFRQPACVVAFDRGVSADAGR